MLDASQREGANAPPAISYRENKNGVYSEKWTEIDVGMECRNRGVRWGDINNDGLDDFICLSYPDGTMSASINRGGNPPKFEHIGVIRKAASGAEQESIRLGDIDGDGRLDWCNLDKSNNLMCFRNGGVGDKPTWEPMVCCLMDSSSLSSGLTRFRSVESQRLTLKVLP